MLADRYMIERELGRGGNAIVYLAHDLKHDRKVAIKVLLPELSLAVRAERFLREIQIAAKLTHPHILGLYDSGEVQGMPYYVMPYVAGESLRGRLLRERVLPMEAAIAIAREIAGALDYAHSQDVIHRDIKPENILLGHGGKPMLADFGIARALTVAGGDSVTEAGLAVGTPAYMSPEQGTGRQDLDARSDIYSLGCVLYEMLAGHPPFTGATAQEVLARHSMDSVPSLRAARGAVPGGIEEVVNRCLAKQSADRYTAEQLVAALSSDLPARSRPRPRAPLYAVRVVALVLVGAAVGFAFRRWPVDSTPSIAVLPFVHLGTESADEYFSDGMTDDLIDELSRVRDIQVKGRTSSFAFKGKSVPVSDVSRLLHVTHVVSGSVRRAGDSLRVTAQLVNATDGFMVWSDQYVRELRDAKDIFAVQDQITKAVVASLQVKLVGTQATRHDPTGNLAAYEDYSNGRYYFNRRTKDDVLKAIGLFQGAIEKDSGFALAWSGLADAQAVAANLAYLSRNKTYKAAKQAALKALALDASLAEAHTSLGRVAMNVDWDPAEAEREYRRAIDLNPGYALVHAWYGVMLGYVGRHEEAIAESRLAVKNDPLSANHVQFLGAAYTRNHQYDQAINYLRQAVALQPDLRPAISALGDAYFFSRRYDDALSQYQTASTLPGNKDGINAAIACVYAMTGRRSEALAKRAEVTAPTSIARIHVCLGEPEVALDWLERAWADTSNNLQLRNLREGQSWDPLRSVPRFQALLKKMGLDKVGG